MHTMLGSTESMLIPVKVLLLVIWKWVLIRMFEMISQRDLKEWGLSIVTLYSTSLSTGDRCGFFMGVGAGADTDADARRFMVVVRSNGRGG